MVLGFSEICICGFVSYGFKASFKFVDGKLKIGVVVPASSCLNSYVLTGDGNAYVGPFCSVKESTKKIGFDFLDYGVYAKPISS